MSSSSRGSATLAVTVGSVALLLLAACGTAGDGVAEAGDGAGEIVVWAHQGQEGEVQALQSAVEGFNGSQGDVTATLKLIPEADYTQSVAAATADELPDVLEVDGPNITSLIYSGKIAPVEEFLAPATVDNLITSIVAQGTVEDELYAVGMFDSGLGMYGNKTLLDEAGVDYPTSVEDAWTADEFQGALEALAATDSDGKVLDIKENYGLTGEWATYGFSPIAWSAGGGLIDTETWTADGTINAPEVVDALTQFQSWKEYVDPNADDTAFVDRQVALSWVGHWMYTAYADSLGDDLVILPLPDFGSGPKTGQGSWAWGISANSEEGTAAGAFLDYLMSDESIGAMTAANGAVPGTRTSLEASPLYSKGGPLELFADQLAQTCGEVPAPDCVATLRPKTAGYPVISTEFAAAFKAIYEGSDVQEALDSAARAIDVDFKDNEGYELP